MFTLTCQTVSQSVMSLLRYFTTSLRLPSSGSVPLLMAESLREANKRVASLCEETSPVPKKSKTAYTSYAAEDRACRGKYAAEHGPTKASWHSQKAEIVIN